MEIRWEGRHPDNIPLDFAPCYSADDGRTWYPLAPPGPDTRATVDFDTIPGGRVRLGVVATDGFNTVRAETESFDLEKSSCWPTILQSCDGATVSGASQGKPAVLTVPRAEASRSCTTSSSRPASRSTNAVTHAVGLPSRPRAGSCARPGRRSHVELCADSYVERDGGRFACIFRRRRTASRGWS